MFVGISSVLLLVGVRASPILPVPTPAQLRYQDTDFVALIHFNMGTYAHNGDPCCDPSNWDVKAAYAAGKTSLPSTFNPTKLNTTQWMDSITSLGAKIAVLTAKHGCGFGLWPTKATLPDGSPYGYNVGIDTAAIKTDVLREFVDAAEAAGVGHGFYYSIMKNFYLCHSFSGTNSCMEKVLPGQINISAADYAKITDTQTTELWTQYGNLTEVWVDSALGGMGQKMQRLQPQAANSPYNPIQWCGTESGHPSKDVGGGPVWSTGTLPPRGDPTAFHGDVNGTAWVPKFCDPQLFQAHVWFWEPNLAVRTLAMMIPIYHDIVGRGMVMELAFSIDRDGLVEDTHAAVYKQLGDWVRACYGSPLAMTSGVGDSYTLRLHPGDTFDRLQLREDITIGQRVRKFTVEHSSSSSSSSHWTPLASGEAVGNKAILLLNTTITVTGARDLLRLTVTEYAATPAIKQFAVFAPCPTD